MSPRFRLTLSSALAVVSDIRSIALPANSRARCFVSRRGFVPWRDFLSLLFGRPLACNSSLRTARNAYAEECNEAS